MKWCFTIIAIIILMIINVHALQVPQFVMILPNYPVPLWTLKVLPQKELNCLATAVIHEAQGEPLLGQVAVAHVILNRQKSGKYPEDICDIIYQPKQFTDIHKTHPNRKSKVWEHALIIAQMTYTGKVPDPTKGSMYFFAPKLLSKPPRWAKEFIFTVQIGDHKFYKENENRKDELTFIIAKEKSL